jgi:acyl dehydratase
MSDLLYLEDLKVGQKFISPTHALDAAQIKAFAREFDPQPFHTDEAMAKNTFFGGLAASGWHTAAITMKLLAATKPGIAGGLIGAGGEIAWPQPTRPDDVLQVTSEILDVKPSRSKPERGMAIMRSETKNQRCEVLQILTSRLIVPRRAV